MDRLFSGIKKKEEAQPSIEQGSGSTATSNDAVSLNNQPHTSKPQNKKTVKKHLCTCVDVEKLDKIKTIAEIEGLNINAIFDLALSLTIDKYEELHGTIHVKKPKKGDVGKVFNL